MFKTIRAWLSRDGLDPSDKDYAEHFQRFQEVLTEEHSVIDERRISLGRGTKPWPDLDADKIGGAQRPMYDAAGVALSGGGIRSAAFCLGALQSLAITPRDPAAPDKSLFDCVDYLSTVSGGGYIGSAVSAAMSEPADVNQPFPFATMGRFDDPPAIGHLRDYSNYLLPRGSTSLADVISVVLRGLATNIVFILAGIFFFAAVTIFTYPYMGLLDCQRHDMKHEMTAKQHADPKAPAHVKYRPLNSNWNKCPQSFLPRFVGASLQIVTGRNPLTNDLKFVGPFGFTGLLLLLFGAYLIFWALMRSRPALGRYFGRGLSEGLFSDVYGVFIRVGRWMILAIAISAFLDLQPFALLGFKELFTGSLTSKFAAIAAPFAGVVAFFSDRLSGFLKANSFKTGTGAMIARIGAQVLILVAAAILPILLWGLYLWVSAAGIWGSDVYIPGCTPDHCWLWALGLGNFKTFVAIWLFFFIFTIFFAPNANSLHQLYRDKLSKAFLFDPAWRVTAGSDTGDLEPRNRKKLSDIAKPTGGPYHLINAAVNLQGSVQANRRGRDASFFMFSPRFVGSDVTDYVATADMEIIDPHIDLGAAMAISGAAVSSNMGSSSIAPLSPTLALLNIRLGYWMANPKYLRGRNGVSAKFRRGISDLLKTYLFLEMFGQLDENEAQIYLTDGGHIENLGVYQLLKRHCRLVIAVDAECDPTLSFHALALVERYARIDLGVRVNLPWQQIADIANAATALAEDGKPIPPKGGPHCAVGTILYPGGEKGVLLYVKATLTGDEPDYVVDYKMRNPAFPHESTGDQFFSEEQFEVYRALGFHALGGFLDGSRVFTCNKELETAAAAAGKTMPDYLREMFPA